MIKIPDFCLSYVACNILKEFKKGKIDKGEIARIFQHQASLCPARNLLLGVLNPNESEFKSIGFLASQPFNGQILVNEKVGDLKRDYGTSLDQVIIDYAQGLGNRKNCIGIDLGRGDVSVYFPIATYCGEKIVKAVKWTKTDISIARMFEPHEYNDILANIQSDTTSLSGMIDIKEIACHVDLRGWMPYLDRFYDSL